MKLPSVPSLIVITVEPPLVHPTKHTPMEEEEGVEEIAEVTADGLQFLGLCDSHYRIRSPDAFRYIFVSSPRRPLSGTGRLRCLAHHQHHHQ